MPSGTADGDGRCRWFTDRLLVSERLKVSSRAELDRDWSADDIIAAHALLDALEAAEARAMEKARSAGERRRPR